MRMVNDDTECCGGVSDLFDQLSMIVPPSIDKTSVILNNVIDGVNQFLCAKRDDTKQTCGASIFQQLTTKYSATEFRLLESFLMPFITAAPGHECNALQGLDFLSSATLRPAPKAIDYSCCASHARPLLESLQAAFTFLTGTTPFEFLNGIVEFPEPSTMKFVDALQAAKTCAFKATCSAPAGLINYKTRVVTPGTNRPPTNDLGTTKCKRVQRCDVAGQLCSEVCERGSVEVPAWVRQSLAYQRRLAYSGPLCRAQLPATHNSAITLADGFGNRDQLMNANLSPKKPYSYMKTNNHVLSLHDQLDMGVRWLEIDTHFFLGDFRTAHCGALGSNSIQVLASVFKEQLAKFGRVSWIPELLGCFPSLSGIKATEQRTSRETMQEIRTWLDRPENKRELVFVYLDQGVELRALGKFGELNAMLQDVFGELLVPITQLEALRSTGWHQSNATLQRFIDDGRRVVLLANDNTGLALGISQYCGGHEVLKSKFINDLPDAARTIGGKKIYGTDYYLRSYEPVLRYISLSGTGSFSRELPLMLNAGNLYNYVRWNLNLVATDSLESSMLAPQVWSWAPNEPSLPRGEDVAVFMALDGRWRTSSTLRKSHKACWNASALKWNVVAFSSSCPAEFEFVAPRDAYQNYALFVELVTQSIVNPVVINVELP
ncbi:hypothetical protein PINS_up009569 [Pythium insidiosum]|nr:hypothetical protein PINS_up009569 [Pythium insidiosum]